MKQFDQVQVNILFNLHERGLLSGKTMLEELGLEADKELKQRAEETKEWAKPLSGCSKRERDEVDILSNRIEQARRNVEALTKLISLLGNDRIDISNTCDWSAVRKATDASIKVMSEVDKL
jgi:hypothetical protein